MYRWVITFSNDEGKHRHVTVEAKGIVPAIDAGILEMYRLDVVKGRESLGWFISGATLKKETE